MTLDNFILIWLTIGVVVTFFVFRVPAMQDYLDAKHIELSCTYSERELLLMHALFVFFMTVVWPLFIIPLFDIKPPEDS